MTEQRIRPNPSRNELNRSIAEALHTDVSEWLNGDEEGKEDTINQLTDALNYDDDGYRIAKRLDDEGWSPDAELVEILNDAGCLRYAIAENREIEWVSANDFKPIYEKDQIVKINSPRSRQHGELGTIEAIYARTLKYVVNLVENSARGYIFEEEELRYLTPEEINKTHEQHNS